MMIMFSSLKEDGDGVVGLVRFTSYELTERGRKRRGEETTDRKERNK
jgi:hypothetical protein